MTSIINTEYGFGSPSISFDEVYYDRGWGDPVADDEEIVTRDTYYGSPFDGSDFPVSLVGGSEYGNDGGEMISIYGSWGLLLGTSYRNFAGPFIVSLINRSTLVETKCYSAIASLKYLTYSDITQKVLKVSLPVLPLGSYDLKIYYGENYSENIIIPESINIIPTNRCEASYSIARNLPSYLSVDKNYTSPAPTRFDNLKPLQALISAIGEQVQKQSGSGGFTLLTQTLGVADSVAYVESTLGLESSGAVFINGQMFSYQGKTTLTLTGIECLEASRESHDASSRVSQKINVSEV